MEKETLLTGFNERLGNPDANGMYADAGVSSRTLDAYIDGVLPTITDDSEVNDTFWERHINFIKAIGGQMRHEKAEFAKNYKPTVTPPAPPAPPVPPAGDTGNDDLIKRLEKLEKEREDERKAFAVEKMRSETLKKAEDLNVSNRNLWADAVQLVKYSDGMDAAKMEAEAKKLYESKLKAYFGEGASPYGNSSGGVPPQDEKALDAFFQRKVNEGKFPGKK